MSAGTLLVVAERGQRGQKKKSTGVACVLLVDKRREASSFIAFAEACLRFTPKVAVRQDEAVFLDLTESDFARSRLKILALAQRFGFEARVAFAGYAAMAFVRARGWDSANLPVQALVDYSSPFTVDEDKEDAIALLIRKLRLLGIQSVSEFLQLPPASLLSRFGKEALEISDRLRGAGDPVWPMFRAPERVGERISLEDGGIPISYDVLESLLFTLKSAVDRSMARLRGRGERASQIAVEFEFERSFAGQTEAKRRLRVSMPVAQGSASGLLPILRDRLSFEIQIRPFPAAVTAVSVEVLETVPGRTSQSDFFRSREQEVAEALEAVSGRLVVQLGDRSAFAAEAVERYRPESAWRAQSVSHLVHGNGPPGPAAQLATAAVVAAGGASAAAQAVGNAPVLPAQEVSMRQEISREFERAAERISERPLRLLAQPLLLRQAVEGFLRDPSGRVYRALRWEGPERISGEWWKSSFDRDYYRVDTEGGQKIWVYVELNSHGGTVGRPGTYHLHGYFD